MEKGVGVMILIVNVCKEKLHYFEFVKPIENILKENDVDFFMKHYLKLTEKDLVKADKIIICGTSLKDNVFVDNIEKFRWIKNFEKPLLGICAGMQIIGLIHGGKLESYLALCRHDSGEPEIGYFYENFYKEFLGVKEEIEVYLLHNNYVDFSEEFEIFSKSKVAQAVKHKLEEVYGVLFHPEVRNKEMIRKFVKI